MSGPWPRRSVTWWSEKSQWQEGFAVTLTLGIDIAVRAAHQATLSRDGKTVWRGRKFMTRPDELERVWADVGAEDPAELTVVLEPTRNAWIVMPSGFAGAAPRW